MKFSFLPFKKKIKFLDKFKSGQKSPKKVQKIFFVTEMTNTFDFSGQKSKKKSGVFFSDFSRGITLHPTEGQNRVGFANYSLHC